MFGFYKEYYSFYDRAPRLQFLIAYLVISAVGIALNVGSRLLINNIWGIDMLNMGSITAATLNPQAATTGNVFLTFGVLIGFVILDLIIVVWPLLAMTVRRLHDHNWSGWFLLWGLLIMVAVGMGVGAIDKLIEIGFGGKTPPAHETSVPSTGVIVFYIVYGIFFYILFLKRGTKGPNRYGADQKEVNEYFKQRKFEKQVEWKQSQTGDKK